MRAEDVTDTLELALAASGCGQTHMPHKPRLLSDSGPSYVAGELADCLADKKTPRLPMLNDRVIIRRFDWPTATICTWVSLTCFPAFAHPATVHAYL